MQPGTLMPRAPSTVPESPAPPAPSVLPRPRRRRAAWVLLRWAIILGIWGVLAMGALFMWFARDLPRPEEALVASRRPGLALQDRTGQTFATFGDIVGEPLRLSQMPDALPRAAVAIEDRRFWTNPGIDLVGLARAAWTDLLAGHVVEGGSTITQQVAKNLFLSNARTLKRKVQELLLTVWLERHFSKQQILEIWLNRVYLGDGAYGVDAAARLYFGVSARHVSLWQAAVLAGLPAAPSLFNPRADPDAAAARGRAVLAAMVSTGAITPAQARAAAAQIHFPPRRHIAAGWFADWAAEQAQHLLPRGADASLRTTLDPRLQSAAETALGSVLTGPAVAAHVTEGAVVALDAATGAVRAMVGGRDYATGPFNRAVLARRQPGSCFKPFVWLAALENGVRPDDPVLDAPIRIGAWQPLDFERRYLGRVTVETALAQSLNTPAVRLEMRAGGPAAVAAVAHRLGIVDRLPDHPSLALGTGEVGVLEMAASYAAFFNGGFRVTPHGIDAAEVDSHWRVVTEAARPRVMPPDLAAMMVRMMAAVVRRGSGTAAAIPGRLVAGKTGTTADYRDAWFIGAVHGEVIAVWLGNDDDASTAGVTGGSLPARIFRAVALAVP
ncbi:MAG TPA: PBP1A family penicillin-binding protein [Acetobacteraceae bacterium]|nr:PBP1A family penicillin-binding protein [Acetobacteraceae bacterium]